MIVRMTRCESGLQGAGAFYKGFLPNFGRLGSWNVIMFLTFEQVCPGLSTFFCTNVSRYRSLKHTLNNLIHDYELIESLTLFAGQEGYCVEGRVELSRIWKLGYLIQQGLGVGPFWWVLSFDPI